MGDLLRQTPQSPPSQCAGLHTPASHEPSRHVFCEFPAALMQARFWQSVSQFAQISSSSAPAPSLITSPTLGCSGAVGSVAVGPGISEELSLLVRLMHVIQPPFCAPESLKPSVS